MEYRIRIKPVVSFELFTQDDVSLGIFRFKSEWEGLQQFDRDGRSLIVHGPTPGELAAEAAVPFELPARSATVVKGSPDLINEITKGPT